ncbi:MAG: hypothetical protein U0326_11255 [Polyangiales bacterium]
MKYAIRLTGTERDLATLHTLSNEMPKLVVGPWTVLADASSPRTALTSERLDLSAAQGLHARGVDVVRVTERDGACELAASGDAGEVERWGAFTTRDAPSLVEAVTPVRLRGDPAVEEVIFRVTLGGDGAQRTIERLLALGRDDVSIAEVDAREDNARVMMVRVSSPPMYMLMRARDERAEGVTAFARVGDGSLWVEWSWGHPLAAVVARLLKGSARAGLVDRDGRWRFFDPSLPWRSVYDALVPRFDAPRLDFSPAEGATRFTVRLRLGPAALAEPELWVLDPDEFLALEGLVEALSPEEIARFTVARLTGPEGTRYVLQEIVRPGVSRMGTRVSDISGAQGFARAPGTDNLYLPPGRQLLPKMRREELRALLELDRARLVIVAEDGDGPKVSLVRAADEVSLSRWVDYVVTDRRTELERLEEESVFEWPELDVEAPPKTRDRVEQRPSSNAAPPPSRQRRPEVKPDPQAHEPVPETIVSPDDAAMREEIRAIEKTLAEGGCDEGETWSRLGALKGRVNELDDAAACFEAGMFHGAATAELAAAAAAQRAKLIGATGSRDELVGLVTRARLSPGEASFLGARVIEMALRGETLVDDAFYQQAERVFTDPETAVSRRLAWAVARTLHARSGDRLGATRARERVLGGMNDRGLSDSMDMPRFVRFAIAIESGDGASGSAARGEHLAVLEDLWSIAQRDHVRELTPLGAYLRLIFAIGFARLGSAARGRDVMEPLDAEESVHELPNRILYKLYRARYAHVVTQGDPEAWKAEVDGLLSTVKEPRVKDRVEWIRTRSEWLRTRVTEPAGALLKPAVERALGDLDASPASAPTLIADVLDDRDVFAYEKQLSVERTLRVVLRTGNDDLLEDVLRVITGRLPKINLPGQRAAVIGQCVRAAATLGDRDMVERLLDEVATLASAPDAPQPRDLLAAVMPGLAALRKLGAGTSARRLLTALEPVGQRGQREGVKVRAALSDGYLQLRDTAHAADLVSQCVDDVLEGALDHPGRYDAAVAVLATLRHWPIAARAPHCARMVTGLGRFTDTFSASIQKIYETHKILVAERIIDAVADDVTFRGDRVRQFLDEEELVIRRRILADWRELCGR